MNLTMWLFNYCSLRSSLRSKNNKETKWSLSLFWAAADSFLISVLARFKIALFNVREVKMIYQANLFIVTAFLSRPTLSLSLSLSLSLVEQFFCGIINRLTQSRCIDIDIDWATITPFELLFWWGQHSTEVDSALFAQCSAILGSNLGTPKISVRFLNAVLRGALCCVEQVSSW